MASIKRIGKDKYGVPIWEATYRRTPKGKLVKKRFHMAAKADVEYAVMIDCQRSDIGLRWSEGTRMYLDAKLAENRSLEAMGHADRAAAMFIQVMGDIAIEKTTADLMKEFMQTVATKPLKSQVTGRSHISGPKVANHHRKELLTVARYLLRHTGKIAVIPFAHVPPLPVKRVRRSPVPRHRIQDYLDAVQDHVRRPVLLVLFYGLRSTSICNLTEDSIDGDCLVAVDKGKVERRIPIDPMLRAIIDEAMEHRRGFPAPPPNLFLNKAGRAWNRTSLLRAAQRYWDSAGLEKKKIHEFRHTLGTLAGKSFTPGMVQALMGHQSRKSAEVYFHPDEEMAAEARRKIVTDLLAATAEHVLPYHDEGHYECPCCSARLRIEKPADSPKNSNKNSNRLRGKRGKQGKMGENKKVPCIFGEV